MNYLNFQQILNIDLSPILFAQWYLIFIYCWPTCQAMNANYRFDGKLATLMCYKNEFDKKMLIAQTTVDLCCLCKMSRQNIIKWIILNMTPNLMWKHYEYCNH